MYQREKPRLLFTPADIRTTYHTETCLIVLTSEVKLKCQPTANTAVLGASFREFFK